MAAQERYEPVFDLIKSMSKAEKRNFKLFATRLTGNQDAKFLLLFDYLDSLPEYDEKKVLANCPVRKAQLPNMKAHLYRQILISIRLLGVQHSETMQMREQLDFAQILFDKGLYRQSGKVVDKLQENASALEEYAALLDVAAFRSKLDKLNVSKDMTLAKDASTRKVNRLSRRISTVAELSDTATRLYSLYQQLGYARTQKDLDLIRQYFEPRLGAYADRVAGMSFYEKFYFYQCSAWFYYIQHDFPHSYRYGRLWVDLFDTHPRMKRVLYDEYMKGYSQILEGLYLMRKYRHFSESLAAFEREFGQIGRLNTNAWITGWRIIYSNRIHKCFIEGEFRKGLAMVGDLERFISDYSKHLDLHFKMLMYYKVACLYFGDGNYVKCMEYLGRITTTKDPQIRRDLQCYARLLNLIASYEAGIDYNLDYKIRSAYSFLVRMNDMHAVQQEMLRFLKRLNTIYADNLREELKVLYERLSPYENHPYERRSFYYLDVLSWLESKITGKSVGDIIRRKFRELQK